MAEVRKPKQLEDETRWPAVRQAATTLRRASAPADVTNARRQLVDWYESRGVRQWAANWLDRAADAGEPVSPLRRALLRWAHQPRPHPTVRPLLTRAIEQGLGDTDLNVARRRVFGEQIDWMWRFEPHRFRSTEMPLWWRVLIRADIRPQLLAIDSLNLWKISRQQMVRSELGNVVFAPDGGRLATPFGVGIALWNVETGSRLRILGEGLGRVTAIRFTPDNRELVAVQGGVARSWNLSAGDARVIAPHAGSITAIDVSRIGDRLAVTTAKGEVLVTDYSTGAVLSRVKRPIEALAVAFSHDGKQIATGWRDRMIHLYDAATGQHRGTLLGHTAAVSCLKYADKKGTLISGGYDGVWRAWDTETNAVGSQYSANANR